MIIPTQHIDTSKVPRKAFLDVLDAIEEFKRAAATENIRQGLAAARRRGVRLGRPETVSVHREDVARLRARGFSGRAIAKRLSLSNSTVFKIVGQLEPPSRRMFPGILAGKGKLGSVVAGEEPTNFNYKKR